MTTKVLVGAVYDKNRQYYRNTIENYTGNVAMPDSVTEAFLYAACKKIID